MKKLGKIGIIGGTGWLGSTMVNALLNNQFIEPNDLWLSNRNGILPKHFNQKINISNDNKILIDHCDTIVISVKPYDFPNLNMSCNLNQHQLIISVMAGISCETLANKLGTTRIIRAMPNVAAENHLSYTPWFSASELTTNERSDIKSFFENFGVEEEFNEEDQINFLTALTGSGQGWIAFLQSCFIQTAVNHGLSAETAKKAVQQLFLGMAVNLKASNESLDHLVQTLIDYAGTTASGLLSFKSSDIEQTIDRAIHQSYLKAKSDMSSVKKHSHN